MKNLEFKLISNKEEIINETVNYYINDNKFNFKINDELYIFNKNDIILTKKNNESVIDINFKDSLMVITLLSQNVSFDMELDKVSHNINTHKITLKYTIKDENNIDNEIIIKY